MSNQSHIWARAPRTSALLMALLAGSCTCGRRSPPRVAVRPPAAKPTPVTQPERVIHIPRAAQPIVIDGETDEAPWRDGAFKSEPFEDAFGKQAPFANVNIVADDENLYLWLYVADGDLHSNGDRLNVEVGSLKLVLNPKTAQVPNGVRLATDIDGTVDNFSDDDEEWVTEVAIPWSLLGSKRVLFRAVRVDVGNGEVRPHALAWPREAPAVLAFP